METESMIFGEDLVVFRGELWACCGLLGAPVLAHWIE
jgi:hypothetical protein